MKRDLLRHGNESFPLLHGPSPPAALEIIAQEKQAGCDPGNRVAQKCIEDGFAWIEEDPDHAESADAEGCHKHGGKGIAAGTHAL